MKAFLKPDVPQNVLHSPVILFHGVIQALAGPHSHSLRQLAILLPAGNGAL